MVPPTLFVSGAVAVMHVVKDIYERVQAVKRFRSDYEKLASFVQRIERFLMETEDDADMTAPGWEAAFSALHEALLEVVAVFDDCAKHGMIRSMINADELNLRLNTITQRLTLALQLIPIQKAKATQARLAEMQEMQAEIRKATFTAVRAAEEQSAALKRLMDQSRVDASKTQEMLAQVLMLLQADAGNAAAAAGGGVPVSAAGPTGVGRVDAAQLDAEVADLRAEMERAVADKKQIEQQYLEQVIAAITAMENQVQFQPGAQPSQQEASEVDSVPVDLLCPITLKLLEDPVILVDSAQTYERGAIQEWLDRGNRKDPVSGVQLVSTVLIPNIAIRKMAQDWAQAHPAYQQQQRADDASAAVAVAPRQHHMHSTSYDIKPFAADQGKPPSGLPKAPAAPFSLQPQTSAVLAAAASSPAAAGSSKTLSGYTSCTSSSLLDLPAKAAPSAATYAASVAATAAAAAAHSTYTVAQAAAQSTYAAAQSATDCSDAAARGAADCTEAAACGAADSSAAAAAAQGQFSAGRPPARLTRSMPAKAAEDKAGASSSSSSFSLGDLQATLLQSAETREKLASRDSSSSWGLFRSGSGKKEVAGPALQQEESLVRAPSSSVACDAPRSSSSSSTRKGSFGKALSGALKTMKSSFVYDDSKV